MLLIPCPWCGAREETEFAYGGEAHITRPSDPAARSDEDWAGHVFLRDNPKGWLRERWFHAHGCRRWFNVVRHSVTHEIAAAYPPGAPLPPLPGAGA